MTIPESYSTINNSMPATTVTRSTMSTTTSYTRNELASTESDKTIAIAGARNAVGNSTKGTFEINCGP